MYKVKVKKILLALIIGLILIIASNTVLAGQPAIEPQQITGTDPNIEFQHLNKITETIKTIGTFIAIGILMIIGIKYVMGSLEERATYKKSMMPYIIGCFLLFGASWLVPALIESTENVDMGSNINGMLNHVISFISLIGKYISVGVLMILGIKYMMGSAEDKASYKKSMMPYIIGCFVLFGASGLVIRIRDVAEGMAIIAEGQTPTNIVQNVGNNVLGIIQGIGSYISVGIIMILGIKYMMGSVEEKATYKKSMLPYVIGAVLVFAAVNITSMIYKSAQSTVMGVQSNIYSSEIQA